MTSKNILCLVASFLPAYARMDGFGGQHIADMFAREANGSVLSSPNAAGGTTDDATDHLVEEKFGEQNFRVWSEMRILAKIKVVIFDLIF